MCAARELFDALVYAPRELPHFVRRFDAAGERRERAGREADAGRDVASQSGPGIGRAQRLLGGAQVLLHRHQAQLLEQSLLAAVPAVQRPDSDSGALSHRRDGRVEAGRPEHLTRRLQYELVVAGRLGLTTSEWLAFRHLPNSIGTFHSECATVKRNARFRKAIMKAAIARRFGPPDVLTMEEAADPAAEVGQVIVDVEYASITFVETQVRAGRPPNPAMTPSLPLILGNGVGGIVCDVGEAVDPHILGRSVVSTTGGRGGYAERVAVDQSQPIAVPEGVALADAVALLADGRTALALMQLADVQPGETVLIEAAAGGVGTCLVQLAKSAGARVIACAGSAEKLAAIEPLGADVVVDYSRKRWGEVLRERGELADVVFDGVGGDIGAEASKLLRNAGRVCQYGMASGAFTELPPDARQRKVILLRGLNLDPIQARALSVQALERAAAGQLRPVVGQVFSLEQAAEAHAAIEARATTGKTLLRVRQAVGGAGKA